MKKDKFRKTSGDAPRKKSVEDRISNSKSPALKEGREVSPSNNNINKPTFKRRSRSQTLKKLNNSSSVSQPPLNQLLDQHDEIAQGNRKNIVEKTISTEPVHWSGQLVEKQPSKEFQNKLHLNDANDNMQMQSNSSFGFDISPQDWKKQDVDLMNTLNVPNHNNSVIVYPAKLLKKPKSSTNTSPAKSEGQKQAKSPPPKQNKGVSPSPPTKQKQMKSAPTYPLLESNSSVTFDKHSFKEKEGRKLSRRQTGRPMHGLGDDDELPPAPPQFADHGHKKEAPKAHTNHRKNRSKDSDVSHISTGPTIEDDRTAGKRKVERKDSAESGSKKESTGSKRNSVESKGESARSKGESVGSQKGSTGSQKGSTGSQKGSTGSQKGSTGSQKGSTGSQKGSTGSQKRSTGSQKGSTGSRRESHGSKNSNSKRDSEGYRGRHVPKSAETDDGIRVTGHSYPESPPATPVSHGGVHHQSELHPTEGNSLPRTPPQTQDSAQEFQTHTMHHSTSCDSTMFEGQNANYGFELPPPCDCNNPVLVQASRIECFEIPERSPCCGGCQSSCQRKGSLSRRGCGGCGCCRPTMCFTPCSCQQCRVFHYCFNILNRHATKPEDMFLGISKYEQSVLKSLGSIGQNRNCSNHGESEAAGNQMDLGHPSGGDQNGSNRHGHKSVAPGQLNGGSNSKEKLFGEGPYSAEVCGKSDRWLTEYTSRFTDFSAHMRRGVAGSRYSRFASKHGHFGGHRGNAY